MAIDFPVSPTVGQQYTYQGATYVFSAQGVWVQVAGSSSSTGMDVVLRIFAANTTYVPSTNLISAIVEVVGGAGGGGGAAGLAQQHASAGGGGAGGYSRRKLTAAQIGVSQTITIGTGGTGGVGNNTGGNGTATSFGALVVGNGGFGGKACSVVAIPDVGSGGAGGLAGTGDIASPGVPGVSGALGGGGASGGGAGGSSPFGGGGVGVWIQSAATNGNNGGGFGSGGAGATVANATLTANGGNGTPGVVVVTEYIGVSSSGGGGGSISTSFSPPQGRLTLQTLTPVMTTTQAAKTAIFYTPHVGNQIPLYNGTAFVMTAFTELTVATTDTANSPAAIGVSKVNDWFIWDSGGGVLKLVHGPDWTSDTARSAGTAIERIQGLWVNSVAITNGPAIRRGTYVGTTRSNASSQLDWIFPGAGSGGLAGVFNVWNCYNRVNVAGLLQNNSASWTYNSTVVRPVQGSAAGRISFVSGLMEDAAEAVLCSYCIAASDGTTGIVGIGVDTTTAFNGSSAQGTGTASSGVSLLASYTAPSIGHSFWSWNEACNVSAAGSPTFYGLIGTPTRTMNGLQFSFRM